MCTDYITATNKKEYFGGFDVVIGNPPYVQITENQNFYTKEFETSKCGDLYALFYEKGLEVLKEKGLFSYITPSLFIKGIRYESLREFLLKNTTIITIEDKGDGVFQDVQMPTAIVVAIKSKVTNQNWSKFIPNGELVNKIESNSIKLSALCKMKRGLEIGKNKVFEKINDGIKILTGEDVSRYQIKQYKFIEIETYKEYKKDKEYFNSERIVIRETGNRITALYVNEDVQQNRSLYSILLNYEEKNYKYILGIINSSLMQFYYKSKFAANTDVFPKIRMAQVKELPIILSDNDSFSELVNLFIINKNSFTKKEFSFVHFIQSQFSIEKLTKKLQNWHELEFGDFIKELNKAIKKAGREKLTKIEEMEWMEVFETKKAEVQILKTEIDNTDNEINQMVYKLYELTAEEISIIENATA